MEAAAPALDPGPTLREFARQRRIAIWMSLPFWLIAGGFFWSAWNDAWLYGQDAVRHTQATVAARWFVPVPDRWWVRYAFVDAGGVRHELENSLDTEPDYEVGDVIDIVHWRNQTYDTEEMDVVSDSDVIGKRILSGMGTFVAASAALMIGLVLVRQRWRRRLLRDGARIAGTQPTLRQRTLPIGGGLGQWRLGLRIYDPAEFAWVEAWSDWLHGPPPEIDDTTALPPVLVDPRRPQRRWVPAQQFVRPSR